MKTVFPSTACTLFIFFGVSMACKKDIPVTKTGETQYPGTCYELTVNDSLFDSLMEDTATIYSSNCCCRFSYAIDHYSPMDKHIIIGTTYDTSIYMDGNCLRFPLSFTKGSLKLVWDGKIYNNNQYNYVNLLIWNGYLIEEITPKVGAAGILHFNLTPIYEKGDSSNIDSVKIVLWRYPCTQTKQITYDF